MNAYLIAYLVISALWTLRQIYLIDRPRPNYTAGAVVANNLVVVTLVSLLAAGLASTAWYWLTYYGLVALGVISSPTLVGETRVKVTGTGAAVSVASYGLWLALLLAVT